MTNYNDMIESLDRELTDLNDTHRSLLEIKERNANDVANAAEILKNLNKSRVQIQDRIENVVREVREAEELLDHLSRFVTARNNRVGAVVEAVELVPTKSVATYDATSWYKPTAPEYQPTVEANEDASEDDLADRLMASLKNENLTGNLYTIGENDV